jgi:hypothetical protein
MKASKSPTLLMLSLALLLSGCVSNRFKQAPKDTPPPQSLNVAFAPSPLMAELTTLITYNGPGSWKRDAFWDEYVVTLLNPGNQPLTIASAVLVDYAGTARSAGAKPWVLEKESKTMERQYQEAGLAFVRYTGPAVLIAGAGAAAIASAGVFSSSAGLIGGATIVALPVYYLAVLSINKDNRMAMEREYERRRIVLPLILEPGETKSGSFFFPMVPGPLSLNLHWSTGATTGDSVLPLDFIKGLHLKDQAVPPSPGH